MHLERLAIEAGDTTFTVELHPRLTVIGDVGRLEREGLINELIAALGPRRPGVHLEVRADDGSRYAIFRPMGGPQLVVDVDRELDVTERFLDDDGQVNVLEHAGLSVREARRELRIDEIDLIARSTVEDYVLSLAHIDQHRLWDTAAKVVQRAEQLDALAREAGASEADVELVDEVERRHAEHREAQRAAESVRHATFLAAGSAATLVLPALLLGAGWAVLPLLAAALVATAWSLVAFRRTQQAKALEAAALAAAGAETYVAFQTARVNEALTNEHLRRQIAQAADYHRAALLEWQVLASDVPLEWAVEHEDLVRDAAAHLRRTIGGVHNPMATSLSPTEGQAADAAHALLDRLSRLREVTSGPETLPVFLDDAFSHVDDDAKPNLLEILLNASARQQVVYLTDDPQVMAWARVEAMTGEVTVVEPAVADDSAARELSENETTVA